MAVRYWESVREGFPDEASGYERCTVALMEAGRVEEAEALAATRSCVSPSVAGATFVERSWRYAAGTGGRRLRYWEAVRGAFPGEASGHVRGAEALLAAGRLEEAEALAVEAVGRFPEHVGGYVQRAEVAMRREDWAVAVRYWESVRQAFPDEASGYERCTVALMEAGRVEEAEALAEDAVVRFPERRGSYVRRAELAMRRGDWAAAVGHWEAVRGRFRARRRGMCAGRRRFWRQVGGRRRKRWRSRRWSAFPSTSGGTCSGPRWRCGVRTGRWRSRYWEAVREGFPDEASGYERCTVALMEAGRWEAAEGLAGEAVVRFPERRGATFVGRSAMRREDWSLAVGHWEAVREGFPDEASGHVRGAEALLAAGRWEEAEVLAGEAVSRFPEHVGGYVQRAEVAMRREDWAVAVRYWESVRQAFPDEASGYERCTVALMEAGRVEEAEALAGDAVVRFPERRGSYVRRAELAMRRGDWSLAVGHWEAVREGVSGRGVGACARGGGASGGGSVGGGGGSGG